jgi:hypothetical protein
VVIAAPVKIVNGSGSPLRVIAIAAVLVDEAGGWDASVKRPSSLE